MSDPGKGVDLTNEILQEILKLLRQKADQENPQKPHGAPHQSDDPSPEADVTTQGPVNTETQKVEIDNEDVDEDSPPEANATTQEHESTDNEDDRPDVETIARYRDRCARHESECEKMQVELGCFIAHLGIVGGDEEVIEYAESLRKVLLGPVQYLESALGVTPGGRRNAMREVRDTIFSLWDKVCSFVLYPNHNGAIYIHKFTQWKNIAINGHYKIRALVDDKQYVKCLEFIHNELFTDLETAMGGVVEALTAFEEKSASEWLAAQNTVVIEKWSRYIRSVFRNVESDSGTNAWVNPIESSQLKESTMRHRKLCNEMREELDHLIAHYGVVGGDNEVVKEASLLQENLLGPSVNMEKLLTSSPEGRQEAMIDFVVSLGNVCSHVNNFQRSLYHQKHAFYFRKLSKWASCLWNGLLNIISLLREGKVVKCVQYTCNDLFSNSEDMMIGMNNALGKGNVDTGSVAGELKTFGRESLPKFLVDQMERDTTRYINLTTIATFFSSVTATTLQFTYTPLQTEVSDSLRGVVNLFWFLSLVFSVSSGVSSLLGLTWRKSSIYDLRRPPWLIHMWFDKAPMLFLIISAVAFVIGLNLFAYLSLQPRFVSLATNILTGLHGMCLLAVTLWFIYQLKHDSVWAGWIRTVMKPITTFSFSIMKLIRAGIEWIWKAVKMPYGKYEQNLHFQRNIFWAFGIDNHVARLNRVIDWDRDWPEPYLPSKIIRFIAYPIKKGWLATKKVISELGRSVRKHICVTSHAGNTGDDVELGERGGQKDSEVHGESSPEGPVEKAKKEFRRSLQEVFSDTARVEEITKDIKIWEDGREEDAEWYIRKELWGYPALINKFFDAVRPASVVRENERTQREIEEQEGQALAHIVTDSPHPAVDGEEQGGNETTSATRQIPSSPSASPAVTTDPPDVADMDVHQDSQARPNDHSPSSEKIRLPSVSEDREVLEPTTGDITEQLDSPHVRERPDQHNEIEEIQEIPSTSEYTQATEGSRIVQSKEEAEE